MSQKQDVITQLLNHENYENSVRSLFMKFTREKELKNLRQPNYDDSLQKVIDNISTIIIEIIERQNIKFFMNITNKNEEYLIEYQKRITRQINNKIQIITNDIIKLSTELKNIQLNQQKIKIPMNNQLFQERIKLKKQKNQIKASILDCNRSNGGHSRAARQSKKIKKILSDCQRSSDQSQLQYKNDNSAELTKICAKINEFEKSQQKLTKEIQTQLQKKINTNFEDLKKISLKMVDWKLRMQDRFETSFSGVWNIILNIQNKINQQNGQIDKINNDYNKK